MARPTRHIFFEPLESRTLLAATTLGVMTNSFVFNDADGNQVTVRLRGPGTTDVTLQNNAADMADIDSIVLHDTTARTSLTVTVKRGHNAAGDGATTIGSITGGAIGSLDLPKATFTGAGVDLTGSLGSIKTIGFADGADLIVGPGTRPLSLDFKTLSGLPGNPATISTPGSITRLRVSGAVDNVDLNIGGNLSTLQAESLDDALVGIGQKLKDLTIAGDVSGNSIIAATTGIGTVTVGGSVTDTLVLAGTTLDSNLSLLNATFGVASIKSISIKHDLIDSVIAAGGDPGADRLFSQGEVLPGGRIGRVKVGGEIAGIDSPNPNPGLYAAALGKVSFADRVGTAVVDPLPPADVALTVDDIDEIIGQAIARAQQLGVNAYIAIVDREGNILAAVKMNETQLTPASPDINITGGGSGGLENIDVPAQPGLPLVSSALAAVSKAGTAAFLSTSGNAFSTRTAGYIIQDHFLPGVEDQPSGPLFGVQLSSLPTSDINRLPLGLSADPGGLPLYKTDPDTGKPVMVGGIGVEFNGTYTIDQSLIGGPPTPEEEVALAGEAGFAPPTRIRADQIFLGGFRLDFANAEPPSVKSLGAPDVLKTLINTISANNMLIPPHVSPADKFAPAMLTFNNKTVVGEIPDQTTGLDPQSFFNGTSVQFIAGAVNDGESLSPDEVNQILVQAMSEAGNLRSAIRKDSPQIAEVNVSVVDTQGNLLGVIRATDAPVFGYDVSVQKARSVAFMSGDDAGTELTALGSNAVNVTFGDYVSRAAADGINLDGSVALSERAIGFLSRPHLPDGIQSAPPGPYTDLPAADLPPGMSEAFSVFSTGLQTDLLINNVVNFLKGYAQEAATGPHGEADALQAFADGSLTLTIPSTDPGTTAPPTIIPVVGQGTVSGSGGTLPGKSLFNGLQIFSGAVPLYKNGVLVGAVGVSGDGTEQDDAVAFAGAAGFQDLGTVTRSDHVTVTGGVRLPYVKIPRSPFTGT